MQGSNFEYTLPTYPSFYAVSYELVLELRSYDSFTCHLSDDQLLQRLDAGEAREFIDLLRSGTKIILK